VAGLLVALALAAACKAARERKAQDRAALLGDGARPERPRPGCQLCAHVSGGVRTHLLGIEPGDGPIDRLDDDEDHDEDLHEGEVGGSAALKSKNPHEHCSWVTPGMMRSLTSTKVAIKVSCQCLIPAQAHSTGTNLCKAS